MGTLSLKKVIFENRLLKFTMSTDMEAEVISQFSSVAFFCLLPSFLLFIEKYILDRCG